MYHPPSPILEEENEQQPEYTATESQDCATADSRQTVQTSPVLPIPNQQPPPQPANPRQTVQTSPVLPISNQQPPRQQTSTFTPRQRPQSSPHHSRSQSISHSPATSRESPASRRSLFSSGYESSMQTTRHISSLLRNFDTIDEPDVMVYLEQIDRQQKQCISYHKLTLDKLNLLIDLLTRVPETPPPVDLLPVTAPATPIRR